MAVAGSIKISASLEDYLEAILDLVQQKHVARAKDIGKRLKVTRASVTGALHALADRHLINYEPYGVVTLTDQGMNIAEEVTRKHKALLDFFVKVLSVNPDEADAAACKIEHSVSDEILKRFVDFCEFIDCCPRAGQEWIKSFEAYSKSDGSIGNCRKCINAMERPKD